MEKNKVEQYLIDFKLTYSELEENIWLIDDPEHDLIGIVIVYDDPLVVFRIFVMDAPKENRLEIYTKLLEFNATDIVHGAYALEEDKIVLINSLDYETMDSGEFQSTLDSFSLALLQHYPLLSEYRAKDKQR